MGSRVTITNSDLDNGQDIKVSIVYTAADGTQAVESFITLDPGERYSLRIDQTRQIVISELPPKSVLQQLNEEKAAE